jgi:hypothetical protein
MFDANARHRLGRIRYCDSTQAVTDEAGRLIELGLYYPMLPPQLPVFETIADEVIAALRKSRTPAS